MNKYIILIFIFVTNLVIAAPIKIAVVAPLNGSYQDYGLEILHGASEAVAAINKAGGIAGNNLEIVPYDDRCVEALAESISLQIAKDSSISAVIGHSCSNTMLPAAKNYSKAGKLVITPSATNSRISEQSHSNVFRLCGRDVEQADLAADFIANKLQAKKIAVLRDDTIYGIDLADHLLHSLAGRDIYPIFYSTVTRGTKDFKPLIKQIVELQIDAIYFSGMYPDVANLALMLKEQKIPLVASDSLAVKNFVYAVGDRQVANSVMFSFESGALQKKALPGVHAFGLNAYAAVEVIAAAIKATNSTKGEKLTKWLHQSQVPTILGLKSWDTNGELFAATYDMYLWQQNGDYKKLN